jgi:hypothetical protein
MALSTYSKFYYGWKITIDNRYIDFDDGFGVKVAVLTLGYYSASEMADEIKKQMDAVSTLNFSVAFDRTTRKFTIATTSNISLLISSGINLLLSAYTLLGYIGADKTGSTGYVADVESGYEYKPQLKLWNYKPTDQNRSAVDGVINQSASGEIEVIKFGDNRFMSCEIVFITNKLQEFGSIIKNDTSAVANFIQFIEFCTDKGVIEFMPDENNPANFQKLLLESTEQSQQGLDYQLIELTDRDLAEYFRSGNLKFRLIEV